MKKLMKLVCTLLMVFLLTGCIKMNITVEVKADKTMTMGLEYLVDEEMLKMSETTTEEFTQQMKEQIQQNEQLKDAKTETITKTIDGKNWVGFSMSAEGVSEENYVQEKEVDGVKSIVLTLPKDELANQQLGSDLDASQYSVSQLKALGVEMNVTIKMPGKVTSNYGVVSDNTVTIDLLDIVTQGQSEDIVISSPIESESPIGMIAMVGVGVVVIAGIIFVVMKKKKGKAEGETVVDHIENETSIETPVNEENKTEE